MKSPGSSSPPPSPSKRKSKSKSKNATVKKEEEKDAVSNADVNPSPQHTEAKAKAPPPSASSSKKAAAAAAAAVSREPGQLISTSASASASSSPRKIIKKTPADEDLVPLARKKKTPKSTSTSTSTNANTATGVDHPRRDNLAERKQAQKGTSNNNSNNHGTSPPGAYNMVSVPMAVAGDMNTTTATIDTAANATVLSAGTQVSRLRGNRKGDKATSTSSSTITTNTTPSQNNYTSSRLVQDGRRQHKLRKEGQQQQKQKQQLDATEDTTEDTTTTTNGMKDRDIPVQTTQTQGQEGVEMEMEHQNDNDPHHHVVSARLVEDDDDDDDDLEDGKKMKPKHQRIYRQAQDQAKQELLQNVMVAEQVVDETAANQRKCRQRTCMVIAVVLIVATLSAVAGSQFWKNDDDNATVIPAPMNDLCTGAISLSSPLLELGEAVQERGSTEGASTVNFDSCTSTVQTGGLGVWYEIEGTGRPIRVSTCDTNTSSYDTQITLFQGSCESQVCVGGNDNGNEYDYNGNSSSSCGVSSSLTWPSEQGVSYKLCVHGKFLETTTSENDNNDNDNTVEGIPESGNFTLTVEEMVENDFCQGSLAVQPNGNPVTGSTLDASSDSQVLYCHGTESTAPGVWYHVVGTGKPMQVIVSSNSDSKMNAQLTIYKGGNDKDNKNQDCSKLQCIAGYDNPFSFESQVAFVTMPDVTYYVLVHGVDGQRGSFELQIQETVENDICETALMIADVATISSNNGQGELQVVQGSTALATVDSRSKTGGICGNAMMNGAGVWYKTIGSGGNMRAFTCQQEGNNGAAANALSDTTLAVFQGGDCRNLRCMDGNDDSCDQLSSVTWPSERDRTYYILVSGKLEEKGSFQLSVET